MIDHCHAYDILVVKQPNGSLSASQALVYFGHTIRAEIDHTIYELSLLLVRDSKAYCYPLDDENRFDEATLRKLGEKLHRGCNGARVVLVDVGKNEIIGLAHMNIFLWNVTDPIAIVDVDGTITKYNLSGFWNTAIRLDFRGRHCHSGVCTFVRALADSTMNVLYLTNRPITCASNTRDFLASVQQQGTSLPDGLLLGFTGTIAGVVMMDYYSRNAHLFKLETIEKHVRSTYAPVSPTLAVGLGNTASDMWCYHRVGIQRIHWIDTQSVIHALVENSAALEATPGDYERRKNRRFQMGFQDPDLMPHALGQQRSD